MAQLRGGAPAPSSPFPILPLRSGVLLPGTLFTSMVGRDRSLALLRAVHPGDIVGVVTQRAARRDDPAREDLYDVGTFARVVEIARVSPSESRLTLEGLQRFRLDALVRSDPFWLATGAPI